MYSVPSGLAWITVHPPAAVYDHHGGGWTIHREGTVVVIAERKAVDLGVHDIRG
jgi:hypothetical protein